MFLLKSKISYKILNQNNFSLFNNVSIKLNFKPLISVKLDCDEHMDIFSPTRFTSQFFLINKNNGKIRSPSLEELNFYFIENRYLYMIEG